MVTVYEVIGDCECLTKSFKNNLVELLNNTIKDESEKLWELKEGSSKFNKVAKQQEKHEEMLRHIRPIPNCEH